jgi:hypothetical protein
MEARKRQTRIMAWFFALLALVVADASCEGVVRWVLGR